MALSFFSNDYAVRRIPPFVTEQSILDDMTTLPLNKEMCHKYYVGDYKGEELIAAMDFIMAYPDGKLLS